MQHWLTKLYHLVMENPTLRVVHRVDSDVCYSDEFSWYTGNVNSIEKGFLWTYKEIVYNDEECIQEKILEDGFTGKEFDEVFNNLPKEEVIYVNIGI